MRTAFQRGGAIAGHARPAQAVSIFTERRHAAARDRSFHLSEASPALVRQRLDAFAASFLEDVRPGLIFESGRLVCANDAARALFRSCHAGVDFLNGLKAWIETGAGAKEPGPLLCTPSGAYAPVPDLAPRRSASPTRICFLARRAASASPGETFSRRELDVVSRLVKGLTNGEIATELGLSIETVRKHVSRALEKTGSKTRTGLVGSFLQDQERDPRPGTAPPV